jgi:hypothetical protein
MFGPLLMNPMVQVLLLPVVIMLVYFWTLRRRT